MKQRIVSALIMIVICIPFIILGGLPFKIFALVLSLMCLYEMLKYKKGIPIVMQYISYLLLIVMLFYQEIGLKTLENCLLIIVLIYMLSIIFFKEKKFNYKDAFFLIGLNLFLGIAFRQIINIRLNGLDNFLYLLIISVLTDTFALLLGNKFGKHKLAPDISPHKTVEGLVGGVILGTIFGTIYYVLRLNLFHKIYIIIFITLILALIGEVGDLVKSSIKRQIGIKDFSNLIPGHGGVLDRLDSLIFISLVYSLIINLF